MALLLHIDAANNDAGVYLSENDSIIDSLQSKEAKNHAAFIQPAIKTICNRQNIDLKNIDAVSVVNGPGSYTGLRVGLASAKGICYALQKPLITLNTLSIMALAAKEAFKPSNNLPVLFCPMIDARRIEVFTAVYNNELAPLLHAQALIINETSFEDLLKNHVLVFTGNGMEKTKNTIQHTNAVFLEVEYAGHHIAQLAYKHYTTNTFADLAYSEPFYLKEVYTTTPKN